MQKHTNVSEIEYNLNIEKYLSILKPWNNRFRLVGGYSNIGKLIKESEAMLSFTLNRLDLTVSKQDFQTLDIGSGAGIPGIIWAIKGIHVDLIERSYNRCSFLKYVIKQLDLCSNVIQKDVCKVQKDQIKPPLVLTALAFATIEKLLGCTYHLIDRNTHIILLKCSTFEEQILQAFKSYNFNLHTQKCEFGVMLDIWNVRKSSIDECGVDLRI